MSAKSYEGITPHGVKVTLPDGRTVSETQQAELAAVSERQERAARQYADSLQRFGEFEKTIVAAVIDGFAAVAQMAKDPAAGTMAYAQDPRRIKYDDARQQLLNIEAGLRQFVAAGRSSAE